MFSQSTFDRRLTNIIQMENQGQRLVQIISNQKLWLEWNLLLNTGSVNIYYNVHKFFVVFAVVFLFAKSEAIGIGVMLVIFWVFGGALDRSFETEDTNVVDWASWQLYQAITDLKVYRNRHFLDVVPHIYILRLLSLFTELLAIKEFLVDKFRLDFFVWGETKKNFLIFDSGTTGFYLALPFDLDRLFWLVQDAIHILYILLVVELQIRNQERDIRARIISKLVTTFIEISIVFFLVFGLSFERILSLKLRTVLLVILLFLFVTIVNLAIKSVNWLQVICIASLINITFILLHLVFFLEFVVHLTHFCEGVEYAVLDVDYTDGHTSRQVNLKECFTL